MILVTGASGFLGQHLVRRLSSLGSSVRALYHAREPRKELIELPGVVWMRCDLLDIFALEDAFADVETVYHCAAIVSFRPQEREAMLHFNKESTANVVNEALCRGVVKMLHVSSVAAIGRSAEDSRLINEDEEWGESKYNSAYGLSKYLAETEVWRGIGEGLNAVIINPSIILGVGDFTDLSGQLVRLVARGFPFYSDGINGWVNVEDVVSVAVALMASGEQNRRFIVSEGNHSYQEVFTLLAKGLSIREPRFRTNRAMSAVAWRYFAIMEAVFGKKALITKETAMTANGTSLYDNTRLLGALPGFAYQPLAETLNAIAAAYKVHTGMQY